MGNPAPGPGPMDPKPQVPKENPVPLTLRPTADEFRPPSPPQREIDETPSQRETVETPPSPQDVGEKTSDETPLRRSTRIKKQVDRFKFDKAHGYSSVKRFLGLLINGVCAFHSVHQVHHANYTAALALDPTYGILSGFSDVSPDFLNRNQWMFKSKTKNDPDTPGIREALTGKHRDEFIQGMANEIAELENHDTWEVIKRSEIEPAKNEDDGAETIPAVIPLTWASKSKDGPQEYLEK